MPAKVFAVLVADVMKSSSRPGLRALLGTRLTTASRWHLRRKLIRLPYSVTAGDEFQTVTADLQSVPSILLDLRTIFQPLSLRIGVGFGKISDHIRPPVNRLGGQAFQRARTALESVKAHSLFRFDVLTAFASPDAEFDAAINLIYGLNDTLLRKTTKKQWETIETFRRQRTLEQAARRLHLDASTVSRNLKRGYYWQIEETVTVASALIDRTFR